MTDMDNGITLQIQKNRHQIPERPLNGGGYLPKVPFHS